MGPPPSPKEPRRSGRRTVPSASSSKSPAGSPTSDAAPKSKDNAPRPPLPPSNNSKNKRHKQDDHDEAPDEAHKAAVNGKSNARANRKGRDKEKPALTIDTNGGEDGPTVSISGGDSTADPEEEGEGEDGEEQGRVALVNMEGEDDPGEFMAQCEICKTWQHGQCMGYTSEESLPEQYFCEQCRPDLYVELLKKHAKKGRQASAHSHHPSSAGGRTSRSHSPLHHMKQPTKRRNTMNSRDAAYEESFQALIEATAAEAAAQEASMKTATVAVLNGATNGHTEVDQDIAASRKKRKRTEDEVVPTKRTRSASTASDRPPLVPIAGDANPPNGIIAKSAPMPTLPTSKSASRNKRVAAGNRKGQAQEFALDGEEAGNTPGPSARRQASNTRVKAITANEHGNRRTQGSAGAGLGVNANSHASAAAASRAYHNTHAYAVSQQPLFTSWGLPDYLAHLEHMLPTDVPRPLEVRGSGIDPSGRESLERTTERGVKVKWPSKRMSVGDMNKRVRALVEWVGREQASALERSRRREAVEKALREALNARADHRSVEEAGPAENGESGGTAVVEGAAITESPSQEKKTPPLESAPVPVPIPTVLSTLPDSGSETMKMMEELMEELIRFQERFGPGAKTKERERRTVTV
ncbi:hypothetical protein CERSUDRAFT_94660 [Gelatoporia subvermispora B]|uniref:Uncharacterized protein n=1 Tax=Ceriporiopsis subvermispora (strain B) TaxID=914234 RepID=M2RFR0_CERS8|nr:hypothetical protein CERSUDRAFT_94660 [Gelatoporia subvermispora B]